MDTVLAGFRVASSLKRLGKMGKAVAATVVQAEVGAWQLEKAELRAALSAEGVEASADELISLHSKLEDELRAQAPSAAPTRRCPGHAAPTTTDTQA